MMAKKVKIFEIKMHDLKFHRGSFAIWSENRIKFPFSYSIFLSLSNAMFGRKLLSNQITCLGANSLKEGKRVTF